MSSNFLNYSNFNISLRFLLNLIIVDAFVSAAMANVCSVAIGNPERHMRKASHCGSKQQ